MPSWRGHYLIEAIVSTFHLAMKFSTNNGVGVVQGCQIMEQRCYATRVRKIKDDVIQVSELELEPENHGRLVLVEELIQVELEPGKKHYWTGS